MLLNTQNHILGVYRHLERYKRVKKKKNRKFVKKTPITRGLYWLYLIKCFLVPTDLIKPLLHTMVIYAINYFSVEGANGMLLNCHMCQLFIAVNLSLKNALNLERKVFTY